MTPRRERIAWLYYGDHRELPFIGIAADTLVRAGAEVTVVDLAGDHRAASYGHAPTLPPLRRGAGLWRWGASVAEALGGMRRRALEAEPTIVMVTRPQVLALGWSVAIGARARIVYYPFEIMGEQHERGRSSLAVLERLFLRFAIDALITQNAQRAGVYRERGARVEPAIVHNYKPRYEAPRREGRLRQVLGLPDSSRIVLYEGYLLEGRWLDRLVDAAARLPDDCRLVLMGEASPWWDRVMAPRMEEPAIAARVMRAPWVPHDELPGFVADADAGVIIYDDQVLNNYYCEPGKLSDYVLAGVPVVAPDFPSLAPRIRAHGVGETFAGGDPAAIAGAIERSLARPRDQWRPALAEASRHLVWETQEAALLRAVLGPSR